MPDNAKPDSYSRMRLVFRADQSGRSIVIRPREFLASVTTGNIAAVNVAVNAIRADVEDRRLDPDAGIEELVEDRGRVRGSWHRFVLRGDLDVVRVARGLRERGIPAQPNHVYFVTSRPRRFDSRFDPNLFAPNLFAPNLFSPNLFAPNLFAPNLFAPNLFAGGGAGCGCCPRGLTSGEDRPVPEHGARPAEERSQATEVNDPHVDIHIIDVASPGPIKMRLTGELTEDGQGRITSFDVADAFERAVDVNNDEWLDPVTGHGDFIQSIIRIESGLPSTTWQAADPLGDIDDVHLVEALQRVDGSGDQTRQRILNLSLSGYTEDDRPSTPVADQIASMIDGGWLIVASAGNNASCRLAWPAALPGVIAVGAWNRCCGPAWFSNHGPWVDASAAGVDVVAQFPDLTATERDLKLAIEGGETLTAGTISGTWASWSGTSFAAPLVAARLGLAIHTAIGTGENLETARDKAIEAVLDAPDACRHPSYGTVVT